MRFTNIRRNKQTLGQKPGDDYFLILDLCQLPRKEAGINPIWTFAGKIVLPGMIFRLSQLATSDSSSFAFSISSSCAGSEVMIWSSE